MQGLNTIIPFGAKETYLERLLETFKLKIPFP